MSERIRDELMAAARDAHTTVVRLRRALDSPYSDHIAYRKYYEAKGRWLGLWQSVEVFDALASKDHSAATQPDAATPPSGSSTEGAENGS